MTTQIIETVTFRLEDGVTEDAFLAANGALDSFLDECPGFLARRLSQAEDGTWLDYLEWRDLESAKAAAAQFPNEPALAPFGKCIAGDSVQMTHRKLTLSRG